MHFPKDNSPKFIERLRSGQYKSPVKSRQPSNWPSAPNRVYYFNLARRARLFRLPVSRDQWFDLWHTHFDWQNFGALGKLDRRKHLNATFVAFGRARQQLGVWGQPHETFVRAAPHDSGGDAVYVHSANPNGTPFPLVHHWGTEIHYVPSILFGQVNLSKHSILRSVDGSEIVYSIFPKQP